MTHGEVTGEAGKGLTLGDAPAVRIRRKRPAAKTRWRGRLVILLLLAGAAGAVAWYWQPLKEITLTYLSPKNDGPGNVQFYTVKRGPLRVTLVEEGKLRAVNSQSVVMQVNGKITWLAAAGSKVKKGDLLVTLDKKIFEDDRLKMLAELDAAKSALAIAEQAVPISQSNGTAALAAAKSKREEAALALKQYSTIEAPKKINEMETQINDTRAKLSDAKKKQADTQAQLDEKMLEDGDEKKTLESEVDLQKQTVASLERVETTLLDQRKLYRAYNYPQDVKAKQQALDNADLEVAKAQVAAKSEVLQKEAEVRKNQMSIDRLDGDVKRMDEQIAKCTAIAPVDGLVFYGSPDMNRYGDLADRVRVGVDWYSEGPIMTIPDLSAFQVDMPIAEVYRGRVTYGMPATVTVEAVPGVTLEGKVETLATVARSRVQWDPTSPQVFDAAISLHANDTRMVAGMTARVEVVTASLDNVLFVPVEAVFNEDGKTVVFQWMADARQGHAEMRPVLTGQTNDHFVEIKKGLSEQDKVALSRPATFITPPDFRELADATFQPETDPGTGEAPATSPATMPATQPSEK